MYVEIIYRPTALRLQWQQVSKHERSHDRRREPQMFGKKKRTRKQETPPEPPPGRPAPPDDPTLPGIAGYEGPESIPALSMPINRFRFVRPDGKPSQDKHH